MKKNRTAIIAIVSVVALVLVIFALFWWTNYHQSTNYQKPQKQPVVCNCPDMSVTNGATGPAPCYCPQ